MIYEMNMPSYLTLILKSSFSKSYLIYFKSYDGSTAEQNEADYVWHCISHNHNTTNIFEVF